MEFVDEMVRRFCSEGGDVRSTVLLFEEESCGLFASLCARASSSCIISSALSLPIPL